MPNVLDKVRIAVSPLEGKIMLIRHGKDPGLALEKREIESEVFTALVQAATHGDWGGAEWNVSNKNGDEYIIRVAPPKTFAEKDKAEKKLVKLKDDINLGLNRLSKSLGGMQPKQAEVAMFIGYLENLLTEGKWEKPIE